jgi:homoprotocatechuate degradation regulator HpaR
VKPAHRNLPLLLLRAREAAIAHFRPILNHFGLTEQQWRILRVLGESPGGLEPGAIAETCQMHKPSLTGILARLAQMKLVARERSATDQRRQRVTLTPHGRALIERVAPVVERQYRLLEAAIGADTLAGIYASLDATLAALERNVPSAVDGEAATASRRAVPRDARRP